jgi:uncharacterized MAPEG superfamily protein
VLIAGVLPLAWVGAAKAGSSGYNNDRPREFLANLTGWQQRANWAQQNALEAFPLFAAAVIIAHIAGASQTTIDLLAGLFIMARIAHGICYITDKGGLRSLVWLAGFGCIIGLFVAAA